MGIDGLRVRHVTIGKEVRDGFGIDGEIDIGQREQGLDLGREGEGSIRQRDVMERLFAHAVAREEQRLLLVIPKREGELSAKPFDDRRTPGAPAFDDGLGVGGRAEAVAFLAEFGAKFLVVEDLAVERDRDVAVFGVHRLIAGGEVDDCELAVAEADAGRCEESVAVGATMSDRVRRATNEVGVEIPLTPRVQ